MSRGPVRPDRQELLVGRCRFFVFLAIAEYPGTQIGDFFFFGLQIEGATGALDCNVAAAFVVERLAQLTIDPGSLVIGNIVAPEMNKACLDITGRSCPDDGCMNFTSVAQLAVLSEVAGRVFTGRELAARCPGRDRRVDCQGLAIVASVEPSPHISSDPHLLKCAKATQHAVRLSTPRPRFRQKAVSICTLQHLLHLINESKGSL